MIPPSAAAYWQHRFTGGRCVFDGPSLSLHSDPVLDDGYVMILTRHDGTSAVLMASALADRTGLSDTSPIPLATIRTRLAEQGVDLHDPDHLFYRQPTVSSLPALPFVRRLEAEDRGAFDTFRNAASAQDLDDALVEFDHPVVFGGFDGDRIVCAASMVPWRDSRIADLGVLTLSDSRGRGHGRAVVTTIADHVGTMGYVPQYRCQTDNLASVALARAAGFASFGLWEVVRFPDD